MIISKKLIPGLKIINSKVFKDKRGFFYELSNNKVLRKFGIKKPLVQDNLSFSKYGVLRGLHLQTSPYAQGKLVSVIKGKILDVAIDLKKKSKFFGKYSSVILSDKNKLKFWIPRGFAHGFLVLSDYAIVIYKTDNFYNQKSELCIKWDDKYLNIKWPKLKKKFIISKKDELGINFKSEILK